MSSKFGTEDVHVSLVSCGSVGTAIVANTGLEISANALLAHGIVFSPLDELFNLCLIRFE